MTITIRKPRRGDVVDVALRTTYGDTVVRGAVVTGVFDGGRINATVFLDGRNDNNIIIERDGARGGVVWSIDHNAEGKLPPAPESTIHVVGTQPVQASWSWPPPVTAVEEIEVEA